MKSADTAPFIDWKTVVILWMVLAAVLLLLLQSWIRLNFYTLWLLAAGLGTFACFTLDKLLSKWNRRRLPEKALLAMSLLGGFIGAWPGMLWIRHKTNHWRFWFVLVLATLLHLILFWFLWQHQGLRR